MSEKYLDKIKQTFKDCQTYGQFEFDRSKYDKKLRRFSLEVLAYYSLKVSQLYGEQVFWPYEIPSNFRSQYNLDSILAGSSTRGGDIFAVPKLHNRLSAVEIKSRDADGKKKNLSAGKIAIKDVSLNKTNIRKNDRLVIHDFEDTSHILDRDLDHWATAHISEFFNDETYSQVRDYILDEKLPDFVPYSFRTDRIDNTYHKKQLTRVFQKMIKQLSKFGNSKGLFIKPTATGKGIDPILLFRIFFLPMYLKQYKKFKKPIVITVSPSLNVLTGNVLKQIKDQCGSGVDMKAVVWASDLTPSDDPKDLSLLRTQVDVPNTEKEFQDIVDNAERGVWIHTTIHSYKNMEIALKSMKIDRVFMKFIDEVKHTVQEWDSDFAVCVREKYVKSDHTLGLDANIVDGKEDGVEYKTSMLNKGLWREIYEEMKEETAVKLGWKRRTKLIVAPWQDNLLPPKLFDSLYENKNGWIRIKGAGVVIPFTWLASICSVIEYRLKHTDRHHTMVTTNKIEWAGKYEKAFKAILPLYLKKISKTGSNKKIIARLQKLFVKSIYNFGSSSKKIQREVDEVPNNHKDSVIIQVKLLGEGWDPKNAWLDSWSFADPTGSKIRIYQTGGRPARIGDDIFQAKIFESHCIVPMIIQTDLIKEIAVNKGFRQLRTVAEAMEIGSDTIQDSVDFMPWQNINVAGSSTRIKGSSSKSVLVDMGIDEMMNSFKNFYRSGVRYSPWTPIVDQIFEETIKLYQNKIITSKMKEKSTDAILKNTQYKKFFQLYSKDQRRRIPGSIRLGKFWMLSEEKKIEGKTLWRDYNQRYPNEVKAKYNLYIDSLEENLKNLFFPDLNNDRITFWAKIKINGVKLSKKESNVMTALMKGRSNLEHYDKEYADALKNRVNGLILAYRSRLEKLKKQIINQYCVEIKKYLNPLNFITMGQITSDVSKKFNIPYYGDREGYEVVNILAKKSKLIMQNREKYKKLNMDLVKKLYRERFSKFVRKNMGVEVLDKEVYDVGKKKHGVEFYGVGTIAEIRKKMPEFKKYKEDFTRIHMKKVCENREKNGWTTWNKGKKTGPRRVRINGRMVEVKGKTINDLDYIRRARDKRKKTMASKRPEEKRPWNYGLTGVDLINYKKLRKVI